MRDSLRDISAATKDIAGAYMSFRQSGVPYEKVDFLVEATKALADAAIKVTASITGTITEENTNIGE